MECWFVQVVTDQPMPPEHPVITGMSGPFDQTTAETNAIRLKTSHPDIVVYVTKAMSQVESEVQYHIRQF